VWGPFKFWEGIAMFHVGLGWYFERLADGSVRVLTPNRDELIMDSQRWAYVISNMSINGEHFGGIHRALEFHNKELDMERHDEFSMDGIKVHTDIWTMFKEIKSYTNEHPGIIMPADIPAKLMLGFVHDDGTYWAIRIVDVKISAQLNNDDIIPPEQRMVLSDEDRSRSEILRNLVKTKNGKENLCAALSNPIRK
jgi:hypothetical protein